MKSLLTSVRHTTPMLLALVLGGAVLALPVAADEQAASGQASSRLAPESRPKLDWSGRAQTGLASFYARMFFGRKMADGTPMNPQANNAASRTLPLGSTALVTNLDTGQSAIVKIQDRGPYVKGRIVDLSPFTAKRIGLTPEQGLAKVAVTPITVALPDGRM